MKILEPIFDNQFSANSCPKCGASKPTCCTCPDESPYDYCPGGCGWDFNEFPERRHSIEDCMGPDCSCYEIIGGHQMGCPFYGVRQ